MRDERVALVTGADQGVGLRVAKDLVAHGFAVAVESRDLDRGVAEAKGVWLYGHALQLDVTDPRSRPPHNAVAAIAVASTCCLGRRLPP